MFQTYFFRRPVLIALALYCLAIVALKQVGFWDKPSKNDPSHRAGERGAITGIVSAHPDLRPTGSVYRIKVETLEIFGSRIRHSVEGEMLAQIMKSTTAVAAPGDRIRVLGRLQKPKAASIPGVFDYQEYLANQGVTSVIYTSTRSFENLGASDNYGLQRWGWRLKQKAVKIFDAHLNSEQSTVLSGLSVGNRPRFNPEIRRIFIESGTMHVLVASGSNVAFVIAMWFLFVRLFRVPFKGALISALPIIWLYVLVAGADAPIARAGAMGSIGILAYLFNREDRPYQALGLTAFLLLLINPRTLFDIGFQMSFVTVFGLIYFLYPLENLIQRAPFLAKWPLRIFAATLTAQLWIAPITATVFQRFFPVSVISNLFVVPLSAVGLHVGVMVGVAEFIPFLKAPIIFLTKFYLSCLIGLTRFFADHMGWSVWVAPPPISVVFGFYLVLFSCVSLRHSISARIFFGLGWVILGFGLLRLFVTPFPSPPLQLTWIDTGKRLTTLLTTPKGDKVLINPGPQEPVDTTERILMPFLTRQGIRSLDAVFVTDPTRSRTTGYKSLAEWIHIDTTVFCDSAMFWISDGKTTLLVADRLTLKAQDALLAGKLRNVTVIQSHFPRNWMWREEFLDRFKPEVLIETNNVNTFHPSEPPWDDVLLVIPQKLGWYQWPDRN